MSTKRSRRTRSIVLSAAALAVVAPVFFGGLAGCASKRSPATPAASVLPVQVEPSAQVELRQPSAAWDAAGVLRVDGTVRRQPGYDGPVAGHVHVDLLSPEQELLDQVLLEWMPADVPLDGAREAAYRLRYRPAEKIPPGATLRLAIVDDEYEHAFPTPEQSGGGGGGGGGGKGMRGGPKIQTPRPLGTPWAPARRTTPAPRQKSSNPATPSGIPGSRGGKR